MNERAVSSLNLEFSHMGRFFHWVKMIIMSWFTSKFWRVVDYVGCKAKLNQKKTKTMTINTLGLTR